MCKIIAKIIVQILIDSFYYGPSCEKLGTLSRILNGFESISFAHSSYFYTKLKCFLLGETTWIGYVIKNSCPSIHFNKKSDKKY